MGAMPNVQINFEVINCGECGINFAVPDYWQRRRRQDGQGFYCPNGHCRAYCDTDLDRVKKELDAEKRRHKFTKNEAKAEREARESMEKKMKRAEKRIHNGVCPHCNRHFTNLERHMHTKHAAPSV